MIHIIQLLPHYHAIRILPLLLPVPEITFSHLCLCPILQGLQSNGAAASQPRDMCLLFEARIWIINRPPKQYKGKIMIRIRRGSSELVLGTG